MTRCKHCNEKVQMPWTDIFCPSCSDYLCDWMRACLHWGRQHPETRRIRKIYDSLKDSAHV